MRTFCAIGVALVMACAVPAAARADAPGPDAARAAKPDCKCPELRKRVVRTHRYHARYRKLLYPAVAVAHSPFVPVYYNPALPSPYDSAYDRAMVLHFRSPPVSGFYRPEPGFPATPPVVGVHYYRVQPGPVFQYDGVTGEYIQLARNDPAYLAVTAPPPPPPPPSGWRGERG